MEECVSSHSTFAVDQTYLEVIFGLPIWGLFGILVRAALYLGRTSLSSLLVGFESLWFQASLILSPPKSFFLLLVSSRRWLSAPSATLSLG